MTFELQNKSELPGLALSNLSAAFQEELQRRGTRILPSKAAASVVLTVTQNLAEYLGTVQIQRGDGSEILIEPLGLVEGSSIAEPAFAYSLRKEFLFSRNSPIVDVVFGNDTRYAYVLGLAEVASYKLQDDRWVLTETEYLPSGQTDQRELRGFLFLGIDSEAVYLPGEVCLLSASTPKGWNCETNHDLMRVRSVSSDVLSKKKLGAWISAAQIGTGPNANLVVTGQDGALRLFEEGPDAVASFSGWGSEIASVNSGCGSGWQLLVTGKGDWTEPDKIQAAEIQDRRMHSVSSMVEFPGAVIALHTSVSGPAADANPNAGAVAIVRNLQTGKYEVYRLTMACAN